MLVPVRCFTCGWPVGDLAPIFHFILRERMAARYGRPGGAVAPAGAATDPALRENIMGDVFEALRLSECCRTRLGTAVILGDHY